MSPRAIILVMRHQQRGILGIMTAIILGFIFVGIGGYLVFQSKFAVAPMVPEYPIEGVAETRAANWRTGTGAVVLN